MPHFRRILIAGLLAVGAASTLSAQAGRNFDAAWQDARALYRSLVSETGIVGASLVVVHDGKVVASDYAGLANREQNRPVGEHTIYHWASNTKTLTGIAIMQLRDRGRLKLEDSVTTYIPELRQVHNPFGSMDDITLEHLMTHSGGFRARTWPWGGDQDWHPHEPMLWSQIVAMLPYTQVEFKPGSKYSYSNLGLVFLGQIIEQLTTDDYEVYIDKNIFKPLEMYRSYFDDTPYHLQPHKAQSYLRSAGQLRPMRPETNTGITVANGGWNAPLGDLVKYVSFVIGDPARRDVYDGVLKRASLEEMFQPQLPSGGDGSPNSIGLTFFIEPRSGRTLISHSGGQNGFATRWGVDFASRSAYIMAFNTIVVTKTADEPNLGTVMSRVRNALIDNVFPTLEGRRSSAAR